MSGGPERRDLPVSWYPNASRLPSNPMRFEEGNGRKPWKSCCAVAAKLYFPTIKSQAGVTRGCGMGEMTSSRSPVCKCGAYLNAVFFNMFSGMGWGHDPRKWRKIGVYCEDLWGIPACRAEIGNWTVVIIGCGIDVVPINQNCWINKKMLKVSLPWRCPKNVRTPSPTIAHYGPIPTAMICRSSSWLRSTCLCLFLYLCISVSVCVCLSHKQR